MAAVRTLDDVASDPDAPGVGPIGRARAAQAAAGRAVRLTVVVPASAVVALREGDDPAAVVAEVVQALGLPAPGEGWAVRLGLRGDVPGLPAVVPAPAPDAPLAWQAGAAERWATTVAGLGLARLRQAARPEDPEGDARRYGAATRAAAEVGQPVPEALDVWLAAVLRAFAVASGSARARYGLRARGLSEDGGVPLLVERVPVSGGGWRTLHSHDRDTGAAGVCGDSASEEAATLVRTLAEEAGDAVTVLLSRDGLLDVLPLDRSPRAAVRIAVDWATSGRISREDALRRIDPEVLEAVLRPGVVAGSRRVIVAAGVPASPGAASGRVVLDPADAVSAHGRGEPVVLVRAGTSAADVRAVAASAAVITATGGQTSHAAVVARDRGVPCIVGVSDLHVDDARGLFYAGDHVVRVGDWITVDGSTGDILLGHLDTVAPPEADDALRVLLGWADDVARVKVRANADTASDAARARGLGAVGIGLCRTEHLFFEPEALEAIRRYLLAEDERSQREALASLAPLHRASLRGLFEAMDGLPVTVRLLDPPLATFLPDAGAESAALARALGVAPDRLVARLRELGETNPVLGLRGVRVGVVMPALYRMQARAVIDAAADVIEAGGAALPTLLVPMVAAAEELAWMRARLVEEVEAVLAERGVRVEYAVGAMIELPRACLVAGAIAAHADVFALGTNDLTQAAWGMARDDHGRYAGRYATEGLWEASPLSALDHDGVGALVAEAVTRGRAARPVLEIGACGEHAATVDGVRFFHGLGVDHVSCSPFRVPAVRLAAAQAALASS